MFGIDVSKFQGIIDWHKVKNAGCDFAIVRLGYGQNLTTQDDRTYRQNIAGAKEAGVKVGAYLYSYAKTKEGAKSEAAHALRLVAGGDLDLPIYYDLEDVKIAGVDWNVTGKAFCDAIQKAGYKAGIYVSSAYLDKIDKIKDKYSIWIAKWGKNNGKKPDDNPGFDVWQYTSKMSIPGIVGYVDGDFLNNTDLLLKGTHTTETPEIRGDDFAIAFDVLKGKYGDGENRKKALGKSYDRIMAIVNNWYKLAEETKAGKYHNGAVRKNKLKENYEPVQYIINGGKK